MQDVTTPSASKKPAVRRVLGYRSAAGGNIPLWIGSLTILPQDPKIGSRATYNCVIASCRHRQRGARGGGARSARNLDGPHGSTVRCLDEISKLIDCCACYIGNCLPSKRRRREIDVQPVIDDGSPGRLA